jgi:hypothetical protein
MDKDISQIRIRTLKYLKIMKSRFYPPHFPPDDVDTWLKYIGPKSDQVACVLRNI